MSPSDDSLARLDAGGQGGAVREPGRGWRSVGGRAAFWTVAGIGPLVLCVAWFLYGFAYFEEMTEAGKAVAAGSSSAGTGMLLGGIPLIVAHGLLLLTLLLIGASNHWRRTVAVLQALIAVAVASAVGIAVNQLLWEGRLFTMYAGAPEVFVP